MCFYHFFFALQPLDLYVLGYSITHSSCDWKLVLLGCNLESFETFLNILNLQQDQFLLPTNGQIKQMVLWWTDPAAHAHHLLVTNIPQMSVFHKLTHLSMCCINLTSELCNHLCEHTDLLQDLLYLDLYSNPIGRGGAVNLITFLTKYSNSTVRELNLMNTSSYWF